MSRGKIHGIWVFCKPLLPLLFRGSLIVLEPLIGIFLGAKVSLESEVFTMLSDCSFDPVVQSTVVFDGFEAYHCFSESFG